MFTLQQIMDAHAKVKSGADFPAYIGTLKALGVTGYDTYVSDGHTQFRGSDGYTINSQARYAAQAIAPQSNDELFNRELKEHQAGKTDYPAFCKMCACTGIEKWQVDIHLMTCTYFNTAGDEVLVEQIPG